MELTEEQQKKLQEKLKNLSPEQMQELIKQQCIFCKIISGEIPAKKVLETNNTIAFLDINPANPGHVIVVPKAHHQILPQIPDSEILDLFNSVKKIASAAFEAVDAKGVNILQNNGPAAGQEVPHVHVHVIPRFDEDNFSFTWEPKKLKEEQFDEIQKRILSKIPSSMEKIETALEEKGEVKPRLP